MENLVGRKLKCVKRYGNLTEKKEYEIKSINERTFEITEDDGINDSWNIEWIKGYDKDGEYHFELLPNEPQFKQGDKVLVSNNKSYWVEGEFITEYKDEFIVKTNVDIIGRKHIKPYKEEIKVGDWVKRISDETIWKIRDKEDVNVSLNSECTKITNPLLIELLNNEL